MSYDLCGWEQARTLSLKIPLLQQMYFLHQLNCSDHARFLGDNTRFQTVVSCSLPFVLVMVVVKKWNYQNCSFYTSMYFLLLPFNLPSFVKSSIVKYKSTVEKKSIDHPQSIQVQQCDRTTMTQSCAIVHLPCEILKVCIPRRMMLNVVKIHASTPAFNIQ